MEDALTRAGLFRSKDFLSRFIVLMLLFVTLLLIGYAELSHRDFLKHHQELAAKATEGAGRLISLYLETMRRDLSLFAAEHRELISTLAADPRDDEKFEKLQTKVAEYFPGFLALTIANRQGSILVDDFDERIEESCINDIRGFARDRRPQSIFIHPNPKGYHFDIMVEWGGKAPTGGIFFISFKIEALTRILADSELPEHSMIILHREIPGLIELTSKGTRVDLQQEFILKPEELQQVIYSRALPNTRWDLVDIPRKGLIESHRSKVRLQVLVVFVILLAATLYMAYLVRREERGRSRAEEALLESHHKLEHRVHQRTRELSEKNLSLRHEIMQRRKAQEALSASEERYVLAVNGSNDGIWDWSIKQNQLYLSHRCDKMLGEKQALEADLSKLLERVHPDEQSPIKGLFTKVIEGNADQLYYELRMRHASGSYRWFLMRGSAVRDSQGEASRIAGSLTDITKRKLAEIELLRDALHDSLTRLPNRTLFKDRLNQVIKSAARYKDFQFAVLCLDLDRFKWVNDSFGHPVGDRLLIDVAERVSAMIRREDTLARLSDDEFAILLTKLHGLEETKVLTQRILTQLEFPFLIEEREIYLSGSIGIAFESKGGEDGDTLLRKADIAMYRAKAKGKGCFELFDEQEHEHKHIETA